MPSFVVCKACGVLVADVEAHAQFHEQYPMTEPVGQSAPDDVEP